MNSLSLELLTEKYLQHCEVIRNYRPLTITGYRNTFKIFFMMTDVLYPNELSKRVFEEFFFKGRIERKWSAVTFRTYLKFLNTFMKWLVKQELIERNFLDDIEKPRVESKLPKTLSRDEAQLILDAAFHSQYRYSFEKYRNRAIVAVMLMAGLRKGEVITLKRNDVSIENRTLFIRQAKGAKDRMIPINSRLSQILSEYARERDRLGRQCLSFFVSIQKDEPIGRKCINNLMLKLKKKTKLDFSAHTLRHAFARLMLEGGCDIYTLSKLMGHSKITTTTIYLSCSNQQMSKSVEMHTLN
jgi:site-specific recombinase XerD